MGKPDKRTIIIDIKKNMGVKKIIPQSDDIISNKRFRNMFLLNDSYSIIFPLIILELFIDKNDLLLSNGKPIKSAISPQMHPREDQVDLYNWIRMH